MQTTKAHKNLHWANEHNPGEMLFLLFISTSYFENTQMKYTVELIQSDLYSCTGISSYPQSVIFIHHLFTTSIRL